MTIASTTVRHTAAMAADLQTASIQVSTDAAAVGDVLVAVLYAADVSVTSGVADASAFVLPAGWSVVSLTSMVPTGDPRRLSGAVLVVQKTVTVAGTDASIFKWSCVQWRPMKLYKTWSQLTDGGWLTTHMQHTGSLTTLRLTGVRGVKSYTLMRRANQPVTYPGMGSDYAVSGHVLRIGAMKQAKAAGSLLPTGGTQRAAFGPMRWGGIDIPVTGYTSMMISTTDVTSVTSIPEASGTMVGDGVAESILVTTTVKPQVSWISPVPGSVDLTQPLPVTWTPPVEGDQKGVAVYRESPPGSGSNIQWWNGAAWQAGSTLVSPKADQSALLPGFAATSGTAYRYLLATWTTSAPDLSDYAVLDLTHRPAPAAPTITLTPAPVAGQVASRVPTMAVSGAATTDGGPVVGWEAQWTDATTGEILASTTGPFPWALTSPLSNGRAVKARARFSQAGGAQWSAWAETAVTINVPKPAAPSVAFATATHPVSGLPLPQLTVTAAAGLSVRVQRDGVTIGEVVSPGPSVKVVDLAAPSGPVSWTVTTLSATPYSERSLPTVITASMSGADSWLFDPTRPETAVFAHVASLDDESTSLRSSVFAPIGDAFPVVQPGVPAAPTGGMVLRQDDPAEIVNLTDLLKSGAVLVLRGWAEDGGADGARHPDSTFRPVGEITVGRITQGPFTYRSIATAFVAAPVVQAGLAVVTGDTFEDIWSDIW